MLTYLNNDPTLLDPTSSVGHLLLRQNNPDVTSFWRLLGISSSAAETGGETLALTALE